MPTLKLTRTVDTAPEAAFSAWTDPEILAQWWWSDLPDTSYQLDPHVGGLYRIQSQAIGIGVRGEYLAIDPPHGFSISWIWLTDGQDATLDGVPVVDTVEVSFESREQGRQTAVTLEHTSVTELADSRIEQGWHDVLDRLPGRVN